MYFLISCQQCFKKEYFFKILSFDYEVCLFKFDSKRTKLHKASLVSACLRTRPRLLKCTLTTKLTSAVSAARGQTLSAAAHGQTRGRARARRALEGGTRGVTGGLQPTAGHGCLPCPALAPAMNSARHYFSSILATLKSHNSDGFTFFKKTALLLLNVWCLCPRCFPDVTWCHFVSDTKVVLGLSIRTHA